MKRSFSLALVSLLVLGVTSPALHAVSGIGVAPGLQEVVLNEGDQEAVFETVVSNSSESAADFRISTVDFGALDESGGVAFLGRTGQETYAYSLSKWMSVDKTDITIPPGGTETIKATIKNSDDLGPGGHYGAIIVAAKQDAQLANDSVAMLPGASTLVLLKKIGGEVYDMQIDSVKTNTSLLRVPQSAALRFENKGNVHVVPRGTIELTDPFNTILARGVINEQSAFILPETHRVIDVPLQFSKQPWFPGRYSLATTWRYDGTEETKTVVSHHWYLGRLGIILIVILCLLIVLYLYSTYKKRPVTRN